MKLQYNIRTNTLHNLEKDTNILQLLDELERLNKQIEQYQSENERLKEALKGQEDENV